MLKSMPTFKRKHSFASLGDVPQEALFVAKFCLQTMVPDHEIAVNIKEAEMEPNEVAMVSQVVYGDSVMLYEIEVNPNFYGDPDFLPFICHECVHIKQYVQGELMTEEDQWIWDGEIVTIETEPDYWFAPWEIEARGLQGALFEAYENRYDPEWREWLRMVRYS